jgi:hypothetical protein
MVYSSNKRSGGYLSRTSDGSNWVNTQQIPNQNNFAASRRFRRRLHFQFMKNCMVEASNAIDFPPDFTIQFQHGISNLPLDP